MNERRMYDYIQRSQKGLGDFIFGVNVLTKLLTITKYQPAKFQNNCVQTVKLFLGAVFKKIILN